MKTQTRIFILVFITFSISILSAFTHAYISISISLLVTFIFLFAVYQWITLPLSKISKALSEEKSEGIDSMIHNKSEFGEIARLIQYFFRQEEETKTH